MTKDSVIDIIHKTIYGFFDVVEDDSEEPINEKDKLLLEVNKSICNAIKEMPDDECKTGKWIHGREIWREHIGDAIIGIGYEDWRCSECHTLVKDDAQKVLWKYCPWCGAKMEGADNGTD